MENEIKAFVTVKNTGDTAGTETVQLYIHDVAASVVRPVKELKDFRKVTLQPGEEQKVEFTINEKELRFLPKTAPSICHPDETSEMKKPARKANPFRSFGLAFHIFLYIPIFSVQTLLCSLSCYRFR